MMHIYALQQLPLHSHGVDGWRVERGRGRFGAKSGGQISVKF
jgi:hypothetical protein